MPISINFPFNCSCGLAGNCLLKEPLTYGAAHVAPDCKNCGNTILITPLKELSSGIFEYNVAIMKKIEEEKVITPTG